MTRRTAVLTLAAAAGLLPSSLVHAQGRGRGWRSHFDGKSLKGWNQIGDANWQAKEGAIWASKGNGYLVTPMQYTDFQIQLEFWVTPEANSGVFIRCQDPKMVTAMNAYEVNIFDLRPDPTYRTGAIVNVAKPLVNITTANKWNTFDITAKGSTFNVMLNGMKTVDNAQNGDHKQGYIALQYGAGVVRFRNIRIREI